MKQTILDKLEAIQTLKQTIEKRMIDGFSPIFELSDPEKQRPLNKEYVQQRIEKLADELSNDESIHFPILLSAMHGALPFTSALQKALVERGYSFQFETIQVSSYSGTSSTGSVEINSRCKVLVGNRDVIVVDDICDTGNTYFELKKVLEAKGARSVELMALVDKIQFRGSAGHVTPKYAGFTIAPDAFIAGFGMDFDELLRNASGINAVDLSTLPTAEEKILLEQEPGLNEALIKLSAMEYHALATDPNRMFSHAVLETSTVVTDGAAKRHTHNK